MSVNNFDIKGLSQAEVNSSRALHGENKLHFKKQNGLLDALKSIAKEPMVLILLLASTIYFISGKIGDGIFLAAAIVLVAAISLYQDARSKNALSKLKEFIQASTKVIRDGQVIEIRTEEIVIGDALMMEEGSSIAADAMIIHSNDFSVNESILTGESMSVDKDVTKEDNLVYKGTTVTGGLAIATVIAIGNETKIGKIGNSLESIQEEKTPLELQINSFVKKMVMLGALVFMVVWVLNFYRSHDFLDSLLKALTLAMSILPEEIPVAFTTFMALGAWRLMKMGVVVKQMKTVETLGSASVICTDKTGTITQNKMSLAKVFVLGSASISEADAMLSDDEKSLIRMAMWASEPIAFDPMEIALHQAYESHFEKDERKDYRMIHEYPLSGKPPMMTHLFQFEDEKIIATKGAPEAIIALSSLSKDDKNRITEALKALTMEGYRVLGVAEAVFEGSNYPATQQEFTFQCKGLVAFYDPPKENMTEVFQAFYNAGINIKIITGDNAETTGAIAKEIGFKGYDQSISGDELMKLSDTELMNCVMEKQVFVRMFPEAKLKIIEALKAQGQIVAMTGDGVNDGPALKASHIGIAMGKKGTEIAKQAASLILVDDNVAKMIDAVAMGRRIYSNLKKAIQYIISIHIPIVLTVFVPLALGWIYPNIFSPVHIIFLELIMGPTCSIIYENEPMEKNVMLQKPRPFVQTFFNWKELLTSIIQGLVISLGTLAMYQFAVLHGYNESITRTMVFTVLIAANIFLTLVNRSFYYSVFRTLKYKNNLLLFVIGITILILSLLIYIKPLAVFFQFEKLNLMQLGISIAIGFIVVLWYELVKLVKRMRSKHSLSQV